MIKLTFAAAVLSALITLSSHADDPKRFTQDRFAIGMWVPPQTSEQLPQRYQEMADANFTLVIGTAGTTAAEQLKLCERYGLRAIVQASGAVENYPDSPACWGYLLADEPSADSFPGLAKLAEQIRTAHPGRFGYVNLYPNYAPLWALQTKDYDEHVARFVREVKPEVLSMDHYPLMRPEGDSRASYCENLETMRKHSLAAGIPFWNYFYCMPFNDRLDPTEAQIRWQIYASVAYGAKGVLYFCYWTPGKGAKGAGEFPKGGAIITAEGHKTRHYDEARRINAELKALGPTLMKLTSTGVFRVTTTKSLTTIPANRPLRNLTPVPGDPPCEYIIGTFQHTGGQRAVLILNHSYNQTAWPTVQFDADAKDVCEVSKTTGEIAPAIDDSPELKGFQISLGPGDARLFLLPPAK